MSKTLNSFVATKLEETAVAEHALGRATFYQALNRVLTQTATPQDLGLMEAINETLQTLQLIDAGAKLRPSVAIWAGPPSSALMAATRPGGSA